MKMKANIIKFNLLFAMAISLFTGCGLDEEANYKATDDSSVITISLKSITCVTGTPTATDIDGYETLQSNDTIIKDEDNTTIAIYHDEDGLKKVCLVSGNAHIER